MLSLHKLLRTDFDCKKAGVATSWILNNPGKEFDSQNMASANITELFFS